MTPMLCCMIQFALFRLPYFSLASIATIRIQEG